MVVLQKKKADLLEWKEHVQLRRHYNFAGVRS